MGPYSEVVAAPESCNIGSQTCPISTTIHNFATICPITILSIFILVLVGCVTELYMQLTSLQNTVENVNSKEVEYLNLKLESLASDVRNISLQNEEVMNSIVILAEKVNRLRVAKDNEG